MLEQLITKEMAGLAAGVVTLMFIIGSVPIKNKKLNKTKIWKDFGIFISLALCMGGSFIPGIKPEGQIGTVIIFGLLSTLAAHLSKKILNPIFRRKLKGKTQEEE